MLHHPVNTYGACLVLVCRLARGVEGVGRRWEEGVALKIPKMLPTIMNTIIALLFGYHQVLYHKQKHYKCSG